MNNIKRTIASAVCIFGLVMSCGSCIKLTRTQEKTVETDIPPKIVFIGDSIAAGYGLDGYSEDDLYNCRSYANILSERYKSGLGDDYEQVTVNKAVSGDVSSQLLGHIEDGSLDEALADSSAVVISIGGNDLLHVLYDIFGKLGYSVDEHKFDISDMDILSAAVSVGGFGKDADAATEACLENIGKIISAIRERTNGEVFIQTLYDPFAYVDIPFVSSFIDKKIDSFNRGLEKNSEYGGTHFYSIIDVGKAFEGKSGELTRIKDLDIHPSEKGHETIADTVDKAVREHTYTYTVTEEVTDKGAVILLIWVCAFAAAGLTVALVLIIRAVRRKK